MSLTVSQNDFTSGILDPRMYNRFDFQRYYSAAQEIENALVMPQGGVTKRFGTKFIASFGAANFENYRLFTFQYDADTEYLLVAYATKVDIYLANKLIASVNTPYVAVDIKKIEGVRVDNRYLFLNTFYPIQSLERGANAPIAITGFDGPNRLLVTAALAPLVVGTIYPAKFSTTATLPVTLPPLSASKTYYILPTNATSFRVFENLEDARLNVNSLEITSAGTGVNNVIAQNTWAFGNYIFEIVPPFDFDDVNYSATVFTPSAVSGNAITIAASAAIFTADYVGGAIIMNGGALIFTAITDASNMVGYTTRPFSSVAPIVGTQVFLGKPAWAANRSYPNAAAVFQNRLYLGGTLSIPGGLWASEVNDYNNFDITAAEVDTGFDYILPSNNIRHIIAARSLLIFTQQDLFVSPINSELPITPQTANFTQQVGYGCSEITPVSTDNQTFFTDSTNSSLRSTRFNLDNGSYIVDDVSVIAKSLFKKPVEIEKFNGIAAIDGNFVFIINEDYNLVILQTLSLQNISAFTLHKTANMFPSRFYRMTAFNNSVYFLVGRTTTTLTNEFSFNSIDAFFSCPVIAGVPAFPKNVAGAQFTSFQMPVTVPQMKSLKLYYSKQLSFNRYGFYETYEDALADVNRIQFISLPSPEQGNPLVRFYLQDENEILTLEEMDFSVYTDCTQTYTGDPVFDVPTVFANQEYQIKKSGEYSGARFSTVDKTLFVGSSSPDVVYGFLYRPKLVPASINIRTESGNNYYSQKTITEMYVSYFETFTFTVQGFNNSQGFLNIFINDQVIPPNSSGFQTFTPMEGYWRGSDMKIVISQNFPQPWTIRGIDYKIKQD